MINIFFHQHISIYTAQQAESPFIITYPNSETCEAQYHTSCSQDIVGVIQDECNQLIVSGWKDNANYDNGGDCDHPVFPKTTSFQPDTTFGNVCYCSLSVSKIFIIYS